MTPLEMRLRGCFTALADLDEILRPHWTRRRELRIMIQETFPLRPAARPRFDGEQTVACYVRDETGQRAKLHCALDDENFSFTPVRRQRAELQLELDHIHRLIDAEQRRDRENPQRELCFT